MRGNVEIAEILLANGVVPDRQDKNGFAPLHYSAGARFVAHNNISGASLEMTELLLAARASPNLQTSDGKTPLHFAATPEIAQALIKAGADPNATAQDGSTPLDFNWDQPAVAEIIKGAGGTNSPQHSMPQPRSRTQRRTSPSETSTPTLQTETPGVPK